ncbi:hypothetical protein A3A70_01585 [candidate division WWE3 bacterium RIFCSPLOWO2_01_FULL_42_11]|uniref:Uncharacterized protein n=1 Tax=candidate division WWE3 bacterium RIFCSPLOWO2_01_FULL_42_11 TaxID=1802627 RepID=A0A1F4VQY0_UNCKA|nr:MAG: hypothetical protein A3A70_01585 [candidate division WWE3 bacterium RIFCSPLOWO2_01_FULL_42_11]
MANRRKKSSSFNQSRMRMFLALGIVGLGFLLAQSWIHQSSENQVLGVTSLQTKNMPLDYRIKSLLNKYRLRKSSTTQSVGSSNPSKLPICANLKLKTLEPQSDKPDCFKSSEVSCGGTTQTKKYLAYNLVRRNCMKESEWRMEAQKVCRCEAETKTSK